MPENPLDYFEPEVATKQKDDSYPIAMMKKANLYIFPSIVFCSYLIGGFRLSTSIADIVKLFLLVLVAYIVGLFVTSFIVLFFMFLVLGSIEMLGWSVPKNIVILYPIIGIFIANLILAVIAISFFSF